MPVEDWHRERQNFLLLLISLVCVNERAENKTKTLFLKVCEKFVSRYILYLFLFVYFWCVELAEKMIKYIRGSFLTRKFSLWTTTLNQRDWIEHRTNARPNKRHRYKFFRSFFSHPPSKQGLHNLSWNFLCFWRKSARDVLCYMYTTPLHTYHKFFADTSHPPSARSRPPNSPARRKNISNFFAQKNHRRVRTE